MAHITTTQLRNWVGLASTDNPNDTVLDFLITQCEVWLDLETTTTVTANLTLLSLMLTGAKVLRWLANHSVKAGYVSFSHEGITKTKSPRELLEVAQSMEKKYEAVLGLLENADVTSTTFLDDLSTNTLQDIKDMWQNVGAIWDFQEKYCPSVKNRND